MASAEEILNSPEYQNANLATKRAIFVKYIARTPEFASANAETQKAIMDRFGLFEDEQASPPAEIAQPVQPTEAAEIAMQREQEPEGGLPAPRASDDVAAMAAGIGFGKGAIETMLPKPEGMSASQIARAQERMAVAEARLREAQRAIAEGPAGRFQSSGDLLEKFNQAKNEVTAAKQELQSLTQEGRSAFRAPAAPEVPEAMPSRTVPGASGAQNWARAMASQELPEATLEQVQTMRKTGEGGAQRLIDEDLARLRKIQQLGGGDYQLTGEGRGQLMLPPEEAQRKEAEMAARRAQQAQEQALAAQRAEQERLAREADFQRRQQAARARVQQTGQQAQQLGSQYKQAASMEQRLAQEQARLRMAQEAAQRAKAAELSPMARTGVRIGSSKILNPLLGGLGAAATVMSADEAMRRFKAGDYSGAVLPTLEAAFGAMSMAPPVTPLTAAIKGLGTVGGLTLAGFELSRDGYDYMKKMLAERDAEKQRAGQ